MDRRFNAAAISPSGTNGSDYTQAGPMPGRPVRAAGTRPELQASGEQGTETIEVYTVRGGNPGAAVGLIADNYPTGPALAWRYTGDSLYRGCDPPDTISEFEYLTRSTVGAAWLDPHAVARPDGRAFQVWQESERYVSVWTRPNGGAWAATATRPYDAGSAVYASPIAACPCLVTLPGNRLLCLFYRNATTTAGIVSCSSNDNGATWSTPQLVDGIISQAGLLPIRIRAAYGNGQISLFVWVQGATDSVIQFASIDDGASFEMVTWTIGDTDCGYPEVVALPAGGFVLATIESDEPTTGLPTPPRTAIAYARRFSNAFDLALAITPVCVQTQASTREWGVVTGAVLTAGELAMTVDDAGVLWIVGVDFSAAGLRQCSTFSSSDGGATWTTSGKDWWHGLDASTHPKRLTVCAQGARLVVPHNHAAAPATAQDSAAVLYLGGPTTVPQPQTSSGITLPSFAQDYTVTWAPYDLPENVAATWAFGSVGAPTISLTGQGVRIQHAGVLDSADWTATPTTTNSQGLLALFDFKTDALSSSVYGMLRIGAAGPSSYEARVEVTPTTIVLRDITGAANIATVNTTAGASGVQIKIAIGDTAAGAASGKVQAWYRAWGSNSDREFILIGTFTALVQGASTTDRIMFGSLAGAAAGDVYVRLVQYAQGTDCGVGLYDAANTANPGDLLGQPIGPAPYPLSETGLRLAMQDGPTRAGESWTIAPQFAYPIGNIDPSTSASPDARWRNLADNVSQRITITLTEATTIEQFLAAFYVDGANVPDVYLDGWNGAAWVRIAALDLRIGASLRYARAGEIVRCNDTGAGGIADFIVRGALRNCTWSTGAGGVRRRIRTNTGGRWVTSAIVTPTRPTVILDSFVVGDPAAGAAGEIWSPRGCAVFRGASAAYSRYSIHIPAQTTAEGYYELGVVMIGGLTILGDPDTSRQLAAETNVETVRARSGSRSKRRLGPPPRVAQIAWGDGLDTSNLHDASPDYMTDYVGGNPVSTPAGIAGDVTALVMENDDTPVVYLPVVPVPAAAATVTSITARALMLYADIASDVIQVDVAAGDEHTGAGAGEYVRVSTVRLEETL